MKRLLLLAPVLALAACGSSDLSSADSCQVAFAHIGDLPKTVSDYQAGIVSRDATAEKLAKLHSQLSSTASVAKPDVGVPLGALADQAGRASVSLGNGDDSQLQGLVPPFNASVDACRRAGFTP